MESDIKMNIITKDDVKNFKFKKYRKKVLTEAVKMNEKFAVDTLEGILIRKAGSYLCLDDNGYPYPHEGKLFEKVYEEVEE